MAQLNDPGIRRYVWLSVGLALGVFIMLWALVGFGLSALVLFEMAWADAIVDLLGGLAVLVLTWFLFPAVVSAFIGLFLDQVAAGVEARHWPGLLPATGQPLVESLFSGLRLLGAMALLNLLILPFLLLGPLFPFVFYSVNGYLLGREYFEMVAARRLGAAEARRLRKAHGGGVWMAGVVLALLLTLPGVNLLAPVIGTAAMVHLFESWRKAWPSFEGGSLNHVP